MDAWEEKEGTVWGEVEAGLVSVERLWQVTSGGQALPLADSMYQLCGLEGGEASTAARRVRRISTSLSIPVLYIYIYEVKRKLELKSLVQISEMIGGNKCECLNSFYIQKQNWRIMLGQNSPVVTMVCYDHALYYQFAFERSVIWNYALPLANTLFWWPMLNSLM